MKDGEHGDQKGEDQHGNSDDSDADSEATDEVGQQEDPQD